MSATQTKKKSVYGVHPGVLMTQKWIGELKQKTGRTLEEWLKHIKKEGPADEKERREHSIDHGSVEECLRRIDFQNVECDSEQSGKNHDGIKWNRASNRLVESFLPRKCLRGRLFKGRRARR